MNADADAALYTETTGVTQAAWRVNLVNYDRAADCGAREKGQKMSTCEDVLGNNFHLHLQGMLGGVGDLSGDMGDLADEHWGHELCLLHSNQSSNTAFLNTRMKAKKTKLSSSCLTQNHLNKYLSYYILFVWHLVGLRLGSTIYNWAGGSQGPEADAQAIVPGHRKNAKKQSTKEGMEEDLILLE